MVWLKRYCLANSSNSCDENCDHCPRGQWRIPDFAKIGFSLRVTTLGVVSSKLGEFKGVMVRRAAQSSLVI